MTFVLLHLVEIWQHCSAVWLGQIGIGWTVKKSGVLLARLPVEVGYILKIGWHVAIEFGVLMAVLWNDIYKLWKVYSDQVGGVTMYYKRWKTDWK